MEVKKSIYELDPTLKNAKGVFVDMIKEYRKVNFGETEKPEAEINIGLSPFRSFLNFSQLVFGNTDYESYTIIPENYSNLKSRASLWHDLGSHFLISKTFIPNADAGCSQTFGNHDHFDNTTLNRLRHTDIEYFNNFYLPYLFKLGYKDNLYFEECIVILDKKEAYIRIIDTDFDEINLLINDWIEYQYGIHKKLKTYKCCLNKDQLNTQRAWLNLQNISEFSFSKLCQFEEVDPEFLEQFNLIKLTLNDRLEKAEKLIQDMELLHQRAFAFGILYDEIKTRPSGWVEIWLGAIESLEPMPELTKEEADEIQELYSNCYDSKEQDFLDFMQTKDKNEIIKEMRVRMLKLTIRITDIYNNLIENELIEGTKPDGLQNNLLKARLQNK